MINFKSGGLLRKVNILADKALLAAYSKQSKQVGVSQVLQSILDGFPIKTVLNSIAGISIILVAISSGILAFPSIDLITRHYDRTFAIESAAPIPQPENHVVREDRVESLLDQEEVAIQQLVQTRISESQKWLEKPSADRFSIKLLQIVSLKTKPLEMLLAHQIPASSHEHVYLLPKKRGAKMVWSVFLGEYANYKTAAGALFGLRGNLKKNQPYIVSLATLKKRFI